MHLLTSKAEWKHFYITDTWIYLSLCIKNTFVNYFNESKEKKKRPQKYLHFIHFLFWALNLACHSSLAGIFNPANHS